MLLTFGLVAGRDPALCRDGGVRIVTQLDSEGTPWSLAWSPGGRYLVAASGGVASIWDLRQRRRVRDFPFELTRGLYGEPEGIPVLSVAWHPKRAIVAVGNRRGLVSLYDALTGEPLGRWAGSKMGVLGLAFSPDGGRLASGAMDGSVRVWRLADQVETRVLGITRELGPDEVPGFMVNGVAWHPRGRRLAAANDYGTVTIWDTVTGRTVREIAADQGELETVAWSPDGRLLASGGAQGTVKIWEAGTGNLETTLRGHRFAVQTVAWHPKGTLIASTGQDETARLWHAASGSQLLLVLDDRDPDIPPGTVPAARLTVAWTRDGRRLATTGAGGMIRLFGGEWPAPKKPGASRVPPRRRN